MKGEMRKFKKTKNLLLKGRDKMLCIKKIGYFELKNDSFIMINIHDDKILKKNNNKIQDKGETIVKNNIIGNLITNNYMTLIIIKILILTNILC